MLMCMHQLPVKPEEGVLDLFQLVPLEPGHLGVMTIPVVVAIAGLSILIACSRQVTGWVPTCPKRSSKQQAEVQSSAPHHACKVEGYHLSTCLCMVLLCKLHCWQP